MTPASMTTNDAIREEIDLIRADFLRNHEYNRLDGIVQLYIDCPPLACLALRVFRYSGVRAAQAAINAWSVDSTAVK